MSTAHSAKPKFVNLCFDFLTAIIEPGSECRLFSETRPWIQIKILKNEKNEKIPDLKIWIFISYHKLQYFYFGLHRGFLCSRRSHLMPRKNIQFFLSMSFYTSFLCCRLFWPIKSRSNLDLNLYLSVTYTEIVA